MAKSKSKEMHVKVITLKGKGKEIADMVQTVTGVKTVTVDEEIAFDTYGVPDGENPKAVTVDAVSFVIATRTWLANRDEVLKRVTAVMVESDVSRANYFENGKKRTLKASGKKD